MLDIEGKGKRMKNLLGLFTLFTCLSTFAAIGSPYKKESTECENGSPLKIENPNKLDINVLLEGDKESGSMTVNRTNEAGDQTDESYKLTLFGKDTYLAIPEISSAEMGSFFVKLQENFRVLVIYSSDFSGEKCGGGLVMTSFTTQR